MVGTLFGSERTRIIVFFIILPVFGVEKFGNDHVVFWIFFRFK